MSINVQRLHEDLLAAGLPVEGVANTDPPRIDYSTPPTQQQIDIANTIIAAHNPINLSTSQRIQEAGVVALSQAKDYLRKQLLNLSPDTTLIVANLSQAINANADLLQMFTNQRNLTLNANGWPAIDIATPVGRSRYIVIVEQIVALLS